MLEFWQRLQSILGTTLFTVGDSPISTAGLLRVFLILLAAGWLSKTLRHTLTRVARPWRGMNPASLYALGQSMVSNFFSGIIILFGKSLKAGDLVKLESGVVGEARENMRSTRITTNDNIGILAPNPEFVSGRVVNRTLDKVYRRIHVPFGLAYGSGKDKARQAAYLREIHGALAEHKLEAPFPPRDERFRGVFGLKDQLARKWLDQSRPSSHSKP